MENRKRTSRNLKMEMETRIVNEEEGMG